MSLSLLISTTIKHYIHGPPQPSWDLKYHIVFEAIKSKMGLYTKTIEELQSETRKPVPVPSNIIINESNIDNKYSLEAQAHLEKLLKPYEHVLNNEWKDLKEGGIASEWVQVQNDEWGKRETSKTILYCHGGAYCVFSKESHRMITWKLAKQDTRVFAIDYRLAPQNQFPAGLQDALAAYLYLLNPPKDAGFEPINPKNIVLCGDSAGGGLSIALGLVIRDAGLPSCAGIVGWGSWVDLTCSMPSLIENECDILPYMTSLYYKESRFETDFREKSAAASAKIKEENIGPKIWHDSFYRFGERMQFYAPNEGLAIPYVSPMLADSLGDLPPLLLVAGDVERLRDETIYFAHRANEPTKYKGPSYNADKFEKSPFQTPTNVTLEIYEEMIHIFQLFPHASSNLSYQRTTEFINRVIETPKELLPPSSFNVINVKGESRPIGDKYKEIFEWKNIGIVPDIQISKS